MNDIAIIGMGCRLPQATNLDHFWQLLKSGADAISAVDGDRYGFDGLSDDLRQGGFIDQYDQYDASFFGISAREAAAMDPQQKIMLEVSWHALQDAGIVPKSLARTQTGVFVGVMGSDWGRISFADKNNIEVYNGTGNGYCMIANRLSYLYNLRGPSLAIDTACSSSLVAVDVASRYLITGEIDTAIVGGVNLMLTPVLNVFYQKAGLASKDGKCKPFGGAADGIVRGEGAGAVVLKRLSDAVKDGDRIYAVIKGSAVNQDGLSNGITAPNRFAQIEVLSSALKKSALRPDDIQYVEAHGTGTLMGDPIEAAALGEVFGKHKKEPLAVGSVKSNIGHLEGAAGIAGIIKAALSVYHKQIPPSLHFGSGNQYINFDALNIRVQTELADWKNEVRRAGVSSFGLGGTNAHLILESSPYAVTKAIEPQLFSHQQNASVRTLQENASDLSSTIIAIISMVSEIPVEQISENSDLIRELAFDSLMVIDLKGEIEKTFNIAGRLELRVLVKMNTVREFIEHMKVLLEREKEHG